jgi:hypothetical protein
LLKPACCFGLYEVVEKDKKQARRHDGFPTKRTGVPFFNKSFYLGQCRRIVFAVRADSHVTLREEPVNAGMLVRERLVMYRYAPAGRAQVVQ